MFLRRELEIIRILLRFEIRRFNYFKLDTIINVISKIVYLVLNLLFWYILNFNNYTLPGWTLNNVVVFIAYSELFYGLDGAVFSSISRFWYNVYDGALDINLTKPWDPRVRFLILNIDYIDLALTIIEFVVLLLISSARLNLLVVIAGFLIVILANLSLSLIRLCASYLSFWHGKMSAISEVSDALTSFNKYPLTVIPKTVVFIFKFIFPFYFFSTFSTEIVCNLLSLKAVMFSLVLLCLNLCGWFMLNNILWKKGLERYESING